VAVFGVTPHFAARPIGRAFFCNLVTSRGRMPSFA